MVDLPRREFLKATVGAAAIAAWGTSHHRLPSKTMTFRWLYWRAGAAALAQRPMFGVGGGNFPTAYLRHRQGASEEAVKVPHNVLVHALVQFGIAGGGCYLAMLTGMLGGIARPAAKDRVEAGGGARAWVVITAAAAGVFVARALLADMASAPGLILVDAIPAAIIVAVVAAACRYRGGAADGPTLTPAGRVIIACGLAAFVLHNMVSFSLWTPGPAMLFWVTAGMVLATGDGGWTWGWKYVQWPASVLAVLVMLGAGAFDLVPRLRKTILTETASSQLARGDWAAAQQSLRAAAAADPGDAETHENVAMALLYERPATRPIAIVRHIEAYAHAQKAAALDRDNVNRYRRMADIANALAAMSAPGDWPVKAREHWAAAVALNPADSHLRMAYAEFLADRKRWKPCLEQLAAAEHIQQQLIQPSAQTFTDAQRSSLERLKARCREGIGPQRR